MVTELYLATEDARRTVYLSQNTLGRVILSVTRITGYLSRHLAGASDTFSYLDSSIVKLVASSTVLWMLVWRRIHPHEPGASDTMGVRARLDHGSGGGFGTKLLQLVTFQYILIPKCKLYC